MERGERWLSLAIFFSFQRINFRGRRNSYESRLPLFGTIYFPTAPEKVFGNGINIFIWYMLRSVCSKRNIDLILVIINAGF